MLQKIFGSLLIGKSGLSLAQLDEEQRRACVDGPLGARGLLLNLTSGAIAVMCPAFDAA
jgi:hypothetical protein